jgi:hypothetical protein
MDVHRWRNTCSADIQPSPLTYLSELQKVRECALLARQSTDLWPVLHLDALQSMEAAAFGASGIR